MAGPHNIEIRLGGAAYSILRFGPEWDKPFLHPLSTPSGVVITRGFPVAALPGESQDHGWHRGIIWGHGLINGHDFWRELGRDKTARLEVLPNTVESSAGAVAESALSLAMLPPDSQSIGTCHQRFRIAPKDAGIEITADIRVAADQGAPLTFGDTEDGGFGLRFREEFRQDRGAKLLNSDGLEGSENIWGKRARWVQYSTEVNGTPASVTMFDHPLNLRHPTYWHARDYGLCAANPFGLHDFLGDDTQDGSYTVEAGATLAFRYRVLVADGVPSPSEVERLFEDFAA